MPLSRPASTQLAAGTSIAITNGLNLHLKSESTPPWFRLLLGTGCNSPAQDILGRGRSAAATGEAVIGGIPTHCAGNIHHPTLGEGFSGRIDIGDRHRQCVVVVADLDIE